VEAAADLPPSGFEDIGLHRQPGSSASSTTPQALSASTTSQQHANKTAALPVGNTTSSSTAREVRFACELKGLAHFQKDDLSYEWGHYARWPHMTGCLDRGGDGLSASYALLYHAPTQCNVSWWFGGNHDTGRALVEMLKQTGLHGWIIIIMIILNIPRGPDNSDLRYNQLKQAQERLVQVHTFRSCALFQDMASEMLVDMEDEIPSRMGGNPARSLFGCTSRNTTSSPGRTTGAHSTDSRGLCGARRNCCGTGHSCTSSAYIAHWDATCCTTKHSWRRSQ
jgi:hypothetical protein